MMSRLAQIPFCLATALICFSTMNPDPSHAQYQPPRRDPPLRTESAGVRLTEEVCSDRILPPPGRSITLTQALLQMTDQIRTILPRSLQTPPQATQPQTQPQTQLQITLRNRC